MTEQCLLFKICHCHKTDIFLTIILHSNYTLVSNTQPNVVFVTYSIKILAYIIVFYAILYISVRNTYIKMF